MPSTVMFASPSLTAVTETSPTLSNNMDYTTDGESYSLFDSTPDLFPNEAYGTPLSPPNDADDKFSYAESPYPITSPSDSKKTAPPPKKRKTWGQQLPEPKTCLAPRKRAKTVDEKEQRRVERVLRNRKAAQISRERKRLEVEQLEREKSQVERRNQELELRVRAIEARNQQLEAQIAQLTGSPPSPAGTTITDVEHLQQQPSRIPTTFTDNLFASSDTPSDSQQTSPFSLDTIRSQNQYLPTIDPTSLSPKAPLLRDSSNASSNDMTQHPAAMLCDLQCQSLEQRPWTNCTRMAFWLHLHLMSILINSSVFLAPLLTTLSYIFNPYSTTLSPTTISIIIWIFTNQAFSNSSNSMTTSTVTKLLTHLLASNPHLARPLLDATLGLLRYKACRTRFPPRDCLDGEEFGRLDSLWSVVDIPPTSKLMTFYWMVKVIEQGRKDTLRSKTSNSQGIDGRAVDKWTTSRLNMADGSNS